MFNILIGIIGTIIASRYVVINQNKLKDDICFIKKRISSEKTKTKDIDIETGDSLE